MDGGKEPVRQHMLAGTPGSAQWPLAGGGILVAIEGGDGAGKSDLAERLEARARAAALLVVRTRDPGGTQFGERAGALIKDSGVTADPLAEVLLFAAARAALVAERIRPALEAGALVLCDRFSGSMFAYQHHGRGVARQIVAQADSLATGGLLPDATLLLDIDPTASLARVGKRALGADRIESEPLEFHTRVRNGFLAEAARSPQRWHVIDSTAPREVVGEQAWRVVQGLATAST